MGRFQVWASARPDGDPVTVWASLLDASTGEVLRQTSIDTSPLFTRPHTLDFPGYEVAFGQRLLLQLQAAEFEHGYVLYHLAAPQADYSNLAVNNVSNVGEGPLAFSHVESGSGLRAAVLGEPSGRIRVVLAAALSVLTIAAYSPVVDALWRAGTVAKSRLPRWRRLVGPELVQFTEHSPTRLGRVLSTPWYPWLVSAIPILHFLANNPLHFDAGDAVVPLVFVLAGVTLGVISLKFVLKDWHRSAAATATATVIFFAYGHVERTLDGTVDERIFFAGAVALGAAVVTALLRRADLAARGAQFANLTCVVLVVIPFVSLLGGAIAFPMSPTISGATPDALSAHLQPLNLTRTNDKRPDIYYIILDAYGRHDNLGDFDNVDFVRELESRGFYIADRATSNYRFSIHSIPSSLNLSYLHDLGERTPARETDLREITQRNALASILQGLGYAYVHLESGYTITDKSFLADVSVKFTPAGALVSERESSATSAHSSETSSNNSFFSGRFLRELVQTTALHPIARNAILPGQHEPYDWWAADRALRMFEFVSEPIDIGRPKFVFAHIIKPHLPATFDQYGNRVIGKSEHSKFDDDHDPTVPSAYIGQLIYVNSLVLNMVDQIIMNAESDPIIVIAGDHGMSYSHDILAAFHLPDGIASELYTSISSVNHFRYILNRYFGLSIDLIEDRIYADDRGAHDFRPAKIGDAT